MTVAVVYRLALSISKPDPTDYSNLGRRNNLDCRNNLGFRNGGLQGARHKLPVGNYHSPPPSIAISAALLLCLSPVAIKYGQEARMHALFMFLSALSTWLLFLALAQPHKWSRWLAFALATTANIYTMYFGFLILAAHTFWILDFGFWIFKSQIINPKSKIPSQAGLSKILGQTGGRGGYSPEYPLVCPNFLKFWTHPSIGRRVL